MEYKKSLSKRIVFAFVLLTALVSGLFGLGIILTLEIIEEHLVYTEMDQELSAILNHLEKGNPIQTIEGTRFFSSDKDLPPFLQNVEEGFTEIVFEEESSNALMRRKNGTSYYLLKDQTAFEKREGSLHFIVFCGFIGSIVAALVLGQAMVKKIIAPLQRLASQVQNREKMLPETPPLALDYSDDEIGHLAKTFDRTLGLLQKALQRESLFTSDVSHELRTPLMMIQSSCEVLMEKDDLDNYSRRRIDIISQATSDMRELVNAFLALARHKDTHLEMVTLGNAVGLEMEKWKKQAEEKGLSFVIENQPEQAQIESLYPAALLRTVLNNLIRNAIHHTDNGRITLSLGTSGFELRDTGPGIQDVDKSSVFKPFYRGISKNRDGIGLGLSLVQRICEREGWTIEVRDNQSAGCCFSVILKK